MIHVIRESLYVSLRQFTPMNVSLSQLKSPSWKYLSVYFLIFPRPAAHKILKATLYAQDTSVGRAVVFAL